MTNDIRSVEERVTEASGFRKSGVLVAILLGLAVLLMMALWSAFTFSVARANAEEIVGNRAAINDLYRQTAETSAQIEGIRDMRRSWQREMNRISEEVSRLSREVYELRKDLRQAQQNAR